MNPTTPSPDNITHPKNGFDDNYQLMKKYLRTSEIKLREVSQSDPVPPEVTDLQNLALKHVRLMLQALLNANCVYCCDNQLCQFCAGKDADPHCFCQGTGVCTFCPPTPEPPDGA